MLKTPKSVEVPKKACFGNRSEFVIAALFYSYTKVLPEAVTIKDHQIKFNVRTERERLRCLGRNFETFREIKRFFNQNHVAKVFNSKFDDEGKRISKVMIYKEVILPKEYYRILIQVNQTTLN